MLTAIEEIVGDNVAGSPMEEGVRWTNKSTPRIVEELREFGFEVGIDLVRRVLHDEMGLSRRQAFKDEAAKECPYRDEQFQHIARRRAWYERMGWPIISVDTKKKEILGNFFRAGRAWTDGRLRVQDHDFVTSEQRLVPYGVYDVEENEGFFRLAIGADTSKLACDAIRQWWNRRGIWHWLRAKQILLLCDGGGSNGSRSIKFKEELCRAAFSIGRPIEVAHYPPGCSKYNPIEHRLFCHATRALASMPLRTAEIACELLRGTTTALGLTVLAETAKKMYQKGVKATTEFLNTMPVVFNKILPGLNYIAHPWNGL